jgi:hypothetical protein
MIENEIKNENYIIAIEHLLAEYYNNGKDTDILEIVNNILSNSQIANFFTDNNFKQTNEILTSAGYIQIDRRPKENKIGIAEFPIVGENNNYSSIRAIEITEGKNNTDIESKIDNKEELFNALKFIEDEIQKNILDNDGKTRDLTILNWGKIIGIRQHLLSNTKHVPKNNNFKINGTSLHFAAVVALVSKILNLPINSNYIFTGAVNPNGVSGKIGDIDKKIQLILKERPLTQKIIIPSKSLFTDAEQKIIVSSDKFIEVKDVFQLIEKTFDKNLKDLTKLDLNARKNLGRARIWAEFFGNKEINFINNNSNITENKNVIVLHFIRPEDDPTAFKIFPIERVYHEIYNSVPNFIIFEGSVANHYTGQLISSNQYRQFDAIFGVRLGRSPEVIVFAAPRGSNLMGYNCTFF